MNLCASTDIKLTISPTVDSLRALFEILMAFKKRNIRKQKNREIWKTEILFGRRTIQLKSWSAYLLYNTNYNIYTIYIYKHTYLIYLNIPITNIRWKYWLRKRVWSMAVRVSMRAYKKPLKNKKIEIINNKNKNTKIPFQYSSSGFSTKLIKRLPRECLY